MPFADVAGTRLHYLESGSGPVALMVHGFPLDSTMWLDQMARLQDVRRCIAVDLRGFGRSDPTTADVLSMERHADDLAALLDTLAIDAVDLVALSMGGYVALAFAQLHRRRLRRLALVDTRAEGDGEDAMAGRDAMTRKLLSEGRRALAEQMESVLLPAGATATVRARIRTMVEGTRYETIVAALAGMRDRPDRTRILADLDVPAAVIVGEYDSITPPTAARTLAGALPQAVLHVVPRAGHMTPMEAPDVVAAALRDLFASG